VIPTEELGLFLLLASCMWWWYWILGLVGPMALAKDFHLYLAGTSVYKAGCWQTSSSSFRSSMPSHSSFVSSVIVSQSSQSLALQSSSNLQTTLKVLLIEGCL
jgi:hypothetical protein